MTLSPDDLTLKRVHFSCVYDTKLQQLWILGEMWVWSFLNSNLWLNEREACTLPLCYPAVMSVAVTTTGSLWLFKPNRATTEHEITPSGNSGIIPNNHRFGVVSNERARIVVRLVPINPADNTADRSLCCSITCELPALRQPHDPSTVSGLDLWPRPHSNSENHKLYGLINFNRP